MMPNSCPLGRNFSESWKFPYCKKKVGQRFYKKHQHTRHEFSALCKWPLSREWTQIKINHPSHHGDISIVHIQVSAWHQDHTLHQNFTLSSKRRLNATLANILGQSYWVWTFIQQAFKTTSPGPGSSVMTERHSPSPPGAHELVEEQNKTPQDCDTPRHLTEAATQPPQELRAELYNTEQWSESKLHECGSWEDKLKSGLAEARE